MGPIAGILVSDFYLVRKMKLDIRAMYDPNGRYRYYHGWNWRAWLTFFVAVGPVLPGFAQSINPNLNISDGAKHIYTFSWIWGFCVCVTLYYVICTYVSPPTESFVEVAVYPPRTEEEEQALINGSTVIVGTPDSSSIDKNLEAKITEDKLADEKV